MQNAKGAGILHLLCRSRRTDEQRFTDATQPERHAAEFIPLSGFHRAPDKRAVAVVTLELRSKYRLSIA